MTTRFRQKSRRWRGRTSHGHGHKKKARGGGSLGGRGYSGRHKHKFSLVVSKEPDNYGKKGFFSFREKEKIINVGDLEKISKGQTDVDLASMGYYKLLSRGHVYKAYNVKVGKFTEKAKAKVEKAGGSLAVTAMPERAKIAAQPTNKSKLQKK